MTVKTPVRRGTLPDGVGRSWPEVVTVTAPGRPWDTISDLEKLLVGAREEAFRRWPFLREALDPTDVLQHLAELAYRRIPEYNPHVHADPYRSELRAFVYSHMADRVLDYWRRTHGKDGERGRRELLVSFGSEDGGDDSGNGGLHFPPGALAVDCEDAVGRLHTAGDRVGDGGIDGVGRGKGERSSFGVDRPGSGAGGRGDRGGARGVGGGAFRDCAGCGWRTYREAPNGHPGWHWPPACAGCGGDLT